VSTKDERKQIMADHRYWQALEKYLPWRLHGFSYRSSASFITGGVRMTGNPLCDALVAPRTNPGSFLHLTGPQRDQLIAVLERTAEGRKG
jgi:hypothetical protein